MPKDWTLFDRKRKDRKVFCLGCVAIYHIISLLHKGGLYEQKRFVEKFCTKGKKKVGR